MYRIRFHGRGGQGIKTASRILGTAFFLAGYEVQDAPRYGAERRGAPIFAYVRADRQIINERGVIEKPDLVVVADDSLMGLTAAGVLSGIDENTLLLIYSNTDSDTWKHRLGLSGKVIVVAETQENKDPMAHHYAGAICAGATARLCGVISQAQLQQAIREELAELGETIVATNLQHAVEAFQQMEPYHAWITPRESTLPDKLTANWVELPFENAEISTPAIHAADNSQAMPTGLWRTQRPVIEYDRCNRCWWVCSTYCPDSAISITANNYPKIDYEHCKGCMVCLTQCPPHAIIAINENEADQTPIMEPPQ